MGSTSYRRRRLSVSQGVVIWVHSTAGSDSNNGLTAQKAKATVGSALTALGTLGGIGTIRIYAPAANPVGTGEGSIPTITSGQRVIIEGWNGQAWWYRNSAQFIGGWTQVGSTNVWTRTNTSGADAFWVETLADAAWGNHETPVIQNTPAGSSPGSFEYAVVSTTTYINLGGVNPNSHTISRPRLQGCMKVNAGGQLTLRNARMKYGSTGYILENAGVLYARDCEFYYSNGSNVGTSTGATYTEMTNCRSYRARTNDGFNHNTGTIMLYNCEAWYCSDEGASPHGTSIMYAYGGIYAYNGSPAFTAANSAVMRLFGVTAHHCLHTPKSGEDTFGQFHWGSTASGECRDCSTTFSGAKGLWSQGAGLVTVSGLTSNNNAAADVIA